MISRRTLLLSTVAGVVSCRRSRGDGYNGYAFVANQEGRAVAAVDLTAFAVARHIPLASGPTEILRHPSRSVVYALTPEDGMLYEIGGGSLAVERKLYLGGPATAIRQEPGGSAVWVLSGPGKRLLRVALDELRITAEVRLPFAPSDFDISEWTGLAALSYGQEGAVSLAELATGKTQAPVSLDGPVGAVRFRSDGKAFVAAGLESRRLTVLDAPAGRVMVHLPLSLRPDNLCFHPDGGQLFITGEGRDSVVVVYPYYVPEVAETVLAGSRPGPMAATGTHLFVTNPAAGDVSIFNVSRRRLLAVTTVGSDPGFVTVTPDNEYALVLNRASGDMAVIRIAGLQPDRRKSAALFTMIPVGSRPVSAAVATV